MKNIFKVSELEKNRIRKLHECGVCDGIDGISIEMDGPEAEDMDVIVIDTPEYEEEMSISDRIAEIERHLSVIRAEQGNL